MSTNISKKAKPPLPPIKLDVVAGVLSYVIPGLGQLIQGRIAKGLVFLVGLYALFFYGWALGQEKNVYIPDAGGNGGPISNLASNIYYRPHFAGQFFIGAAAWPAIWQYYHFDKTKQEGPVIGDFMRAPTGDEINRLQREESKTWDLGWVYTVIAGVLNILVIYDAVAGPAFREVARKGLDPPKNPEPVAV